MQNERMPKQSCNSHRGRNEEEGADGPVMLETCQSLCVLKYYCNYK